jgi:hypothetical protein
VALQVKSGSFSLNNATGNQVVSWATGGNWPSSATPKLVLFLATGQTADGTTQHGIGMLGAAVSATQRWVLSQASDDAAAAVNSGQSARTTACIVLLSNGTPTVQAVADFVSFGAEQFTINVTTAPGVAGVQVGYIAFGGADLTDVAVGSSTIPIVTGNQAITPTGFTGKTPDAIVTAVPYQPASPTESVHSHFGLGWATRLPSTAQGVAWMNEIDASTAIDTQRGFLTTACVGGAETTNTTRAYGSLGSWDADGFTVNWADAAATASRIWLYVAIKGGGWQAFSDTETITDTGKATAVSGFGANSPKGLLLIGSNGTADTAPTDTANGDCLIALGASDGTTECAVANIQVNGSGTASNSLAKRRLAATKAISLVKTPTTTSPWATVCGEADATFQAGQVTLTWSGTDGTARKFLGLAVGDTFPVDPNAPVSSSSGSNSTAAATVTATFTHAGVVAGNALLLLVGAHYGNTGNINTPTSTPSETWTRVGAEIADAAANTYALYYATGVAGGSYTLNASATGSGGTVTAVDAVSIELPNIATGAALDQTASNTAAAATTVSVTTATTTQATETVGVLCGLGLVAPAMTPGSGYAAYGPTLGSGTLMGLAFEWKSVATTGAQAASFTASSANLVLIVGTFKQATGGGPAAQTLALAGVGSGEAAGVAAALPGPVAVALAAALSAEASGQPATTPAYTAPLAGAGSAEVAGQPAMSTAYTAVPSGAASGERAGQATALPGAVALLPAGVPSAEASGQTAVAVLAALALAGVASVAASGTPTVLPGPVTAALAGVGSGEAAGQPAVGVFTFVGLAGAGSGERAGQPAALPGGLTLPLAGAGSGEAAGQLVVATVGAPATLILSGAGTGERAGATLAVPGVVLLTPAGLGSAERAGVATTLPGGLVLPLSGAGSGEQRGALALSTTVALALAGVGSGERAGAGLVLPGAVALALAGARSGEFAGVLTIGGIAIPFFIFVAKPQHEGFGAGGELFVFVARTQGQGG